MYYLTETFTTNLDGTFCCLISIFSHQKLEKKKVHYFMPISNKMYFVQKFFITLLLSASCLFLLPQKVYMWATQTHTMWNTYLCLYLLSSLWAVTVGNGLTRRGCTTSKHSLCFLQKKIHATECMQNICGPWQFIKHFQKATFSKQFPGIGKDERRQKTVSS